MGDLQGTQISAMRHKFLYLCLLLAVCVAGTGLWRVTSAQATGPSQANYLTAWNPRAAADYLDRRESWWQNWPGARVDHGTICVSCHTVVPYAMMRSALGQELHETAMPAPEIIMIRNVETRVNHWSEMVPFYSDATDGPGKTAQSHATEAMLNAVILASYDKQNGHLRPITRAAFDEAWALQEQSGEDVGGWKWEDFHLAPFEYAESGYQGAAMLMMAIENEPDGYAEDQQAQPHLEQLRQYLRSHYAAQPLLNQLYILWLSSKESSLMTTSERETLLSAVKSRQRSDGGWSLSSLDPRSRLDNGQWKRLEQQFREQFIDLVKPGDSDGYATGLVVLALEESGSHVQDGSVNRGLKWLRCHQESDGRWRTLSLNGNVDPETNLGRFMSDAATAYAVMALENTDAQLTRK
jgi:squalene-hopene/tetraprenyl-beta-curcumene cyclase